MPVDVYTIFASSTASLLSRLATHPLDTLKTRVQAHNTGRSRSLYQTALTIIRTEPLTSFYRGLPVTLLFSVPGLSVYLAVYDLSKSALFTHLGLSSDRVWNHLASGLVAEVVSGLFWTPMEVLKSRLQMEPMACAGEFPRELTSTTTRALAGQIWAEEGVRGFFKGYFLSLAVFVPYTMTYFAVYERLKSIARPPKSGSDSVSQQPLPFQTYLACSSVSCALAASLSNALDIVKTRWQISTALAGDLQRGYRTSPREIVRRAWREEGGWRAFTRGMGARVVWAVPTTAISMTCFEVIKDWRG